MKERVVDIKERVLDMKKVFLFFIIFFTVAFGYICICAFVYSRKEYHTKYDFIIHRIESNEKGYLTFYDSLGNKYSFASYYFSESQKLGISEGDRVFKDIYAKDMFFSRKVDDKYEVYYVQEPNGLLPFSFYSY